MEFNSPYYKPEKPKNSWQLLQWVIFEPLLVRRYNKILKKKEQIIIFLKAYAWLSIIIIGIFFLGNSIIAAANIPSLIHTEELRSNFKSGWQVQDSFLDKYRYLLKYNSWGLLLGLLLGFGGGLSVVLIRRLDFGLPFALYFGLTLGLVAGLVAGLAAGLVYGLYLGLILGIILGLTLGFTLALSREPNLGEDKRWIIELIGGVGIGLIFGLLFGLIEGVVIGLALGLVFIPFFYISYFRLYHFYYLVRFINLNFYHNPYLIDGFIRLSLWGHRKQLTQLALKEPEQAAQFTQFLLDYRPLQITLARYLIHAILAGYMEKFILEADYLENPIIDSRAKNLQPDEDWKKIRLKAQFFLIQSQQETNPHFKLDAFKAFWEALLKFEDIHRIQHPSWKGYYDNGIKLWKEAAVKKLEELEQAAAPYTRNPYQSGNPLNPQRNREVFRGREDLRRKLDNSLKNAETLPLFLIQGQRRVGKTSLLYFLSELLTGRFKVIQMDLQSTEECPNVSGWLERIRYHVEEAFDMEVKEGEEWKAGEDWAQSWNELSQYLQALSRKENYRIVLAFDEYESLHFRGLTKDAKQASTLLDNMRSFSQHQRDVIFLFAGAHLFSELSDPDWGNYFVQAIHLKVDYLSEKDSLDLIIHPYDGFDIHYEAGIPEKIYELTQGHPALLQSICYELVELANDELRKELDKTDLEKVLNEKILFLGNASLTVFWNQFCKEAIMKETVRAVILKQDIPDRESLRKLLLHEFVVKNEDGSYRMRAPIFEQWVRKFDLEI